jgi:hypothetical protein
MNKNYLWKAASERERRSHKRFKCNALVHLVYRRVTQKTSQSARAVVVQISQGGCRIRVAIPELPDYFYLVIGKFEYAIGCAALRREGEEYSIEFIKEQPQRLVEAFAMLSLPMAPLFSLKGLLRNEIDTIAAGTTTRPDQTRGVDDIAVGVSGPNHCHERSVSPITTASKLSLIGHVRD